MEKQNQSILRHLENAELIGITFIKAYIQFIFEGATLNTYTLPKIQTSNKTFFYTEPGYYDTLYSLIGKRILSATEEKEKKIKMKFENGIVLSVSLKMEDRVCVEAVILQVESEGEWNVW